MLDIGWTELLVIAVVLIVVVGPKDLPPMIRAFGKMTANFRKMAGDFRAQFDEALREADMDDVRKTISDAQKLNPTNALRDAINPLRQMGEDLKADLQKATQIPNPLADNKTDLSPDDAQAQQAIESAEPVSAAPEVPASVEPLTPASSSSAASAPLAQMAPVSDTKTVAGTQAATAAAAAVATAPVEAKPAAQKTRAPRKTPAKAADDAKPAGKTAASMATITEAVPAEKPKRTRSAPKQPVETVADAPVAKAPRKRAAKKTDTPKDEA
jgi:sec-independent protein translocase protein TatB